jgi:hypothetical protein
MEKLEQLASKDPGQDTHRDEEIGTASNPVIASGGEAAPGDDAVDVGVEGQGLGPGVKHSDRAWGCSQAALTHALKCAECGLEEQAVAVAPLCQEERVQGRWYGENQVEIGHGKKVARLGFDPARLLQALALGAMAVAAGVVEGLFAAAMVAHLEMAAQKRSSTGDDVLDHPTTVAS